MATGGPSIPQMGATSFSHEIAREFGGADSPGFVNGVLDALFKLQDGTAAGQSGTL
ncbi:MAG: hypothetical protein IID40_12355 [Planctomycetes bacterium]|nr:hypothetical protein [Planctomycetota bacterium]